MDRAQAHAVVVEAINRGVVLPLEVEAGGTIIRKTIDLQALRFEAEQHGHALARSIHYAANLFLDAYGTQRGLEIVRGRTQQQGNSLA